MWGSESRRCCSGQVAVLVDSAEDAGAQEAARIEVVHGGGLVDRVGWQLTAGPMGPVRGVVFLVGGQDLSGVGLAHEGLSRMPPMLLPRPARLPPQRPGPLPENQPQRLRMDTPDRNSRCVPAPLPPTGGEKTPGPEQQGRDRSCPRATSP
ncbi:hypothetical protein ACR6C2_36445 [Streptomyces sp. INA 01156]